jgi:protein SCO1/2
MPTPLLSLVLLAPPLLVTAEVPRAQALEAPGSVQAAAPQAAGEEAGASSVRDTGRADDQRLAGNRWGAQYFPNVELTTHDGRSVRFFDDMIEGRVVVLNFIYTACPDACPMETARLAEVQEILGDRIGEDVFMYSITIDPDRDTPEVLAEYRSRFGARDGWTFLTGDEEDILLLRRKLGLYIEEEGKAETDHNLNMLIGNQATGHWLKRSPFENPYVLATQIGSWLSDYRHAGSGTSDFADAPERMPDMTRAESMYRARCLVCHRVGQGDGLLRIGPNLLGVTERRDRDWLRRWILEPDAMLEEGDPIAQGLFEAYNRVPMPNLQLAPDEVEDLIDFLDAETRRATAIEKNEAIAETQGKDLPECCQKDELGVIESAPAEQQALPEPAPGPGPSKDLWDRVSMALGTLCAASAVLLQLRQRR